jgi:hypothetical protein
VTKTPRVTTWMVSPNVAGALSPRLDPHEDRRVDVRAALDVIWRR